MNFNQFRLLSFDCYGTLIDWKTSIQNILKPVIGSYSLDISKDQLFDLYLKADQKCISEDYRPYQEILLTIMDEIGRELNINLRNIDRTCLVNRFGDWIAFPDTIGALQELQKRYRLAIISNVDDELFNMTKRCLSIHFDFIITARQVRSYKPSKNNFIKALEKFELPSEQVLHVAQSIYHDIIPTNELGWNNVWVNRYNEPGRTDPAEFPDLEVPDLATLARIIREA
jgi:2-haloacid dehalogenase